MSHDLTTHPLDLPEWAFPRDLAPAEFPAWVEAVEQRMIEHPQRVDVLEHMPIVNRVTPFLYIREIFMPAGTILTSWIHKYEHPYTISQGDVSVMTEDGPVRLKAPYTGITKPGTKRVLFPHTDTIWTTYHVTDRDVTLLTDEEIKRVFACDSFAEYERFTRGEL